MEPQSPSATSQAAVHLLPDTPNAAAAGAASAPPPPPPQEQSSPAASAPEPIALQPMPAPAAAAPAIGGVGLRSRQVDDSGRIRIGGGAMRQPTNESGMPEFFSRYKADPVPAADSDKSRAPSQVGPNQSFYDFATGQLKPTKPSARDEWWDEPAVEPGSGRERVGTVVHGRVPVGRVGQEATGSRFTLKYFVAQFWAHIMLPWSLPFFVAIEGKIRAQNQSLIPGSHMTFAQGLRAAFGQNLFPLCWWFIVLLRAIRHPEGVSDVEFFLAVFGYVAHRLVLATKYALLTDEYTRALGRKLISQNVHRNIELVTGWATPSIEVCDRELRAAGRKLGIHLERVGVILNKGDLDAPDPATGEGGEPRRGSMAAADQVADPLFGVGLTSVADRQLDPAVAPEAGPAHHGSVVVGAGGHVRSASVQGQGRSGSVAAGAGFGGAPASDTAKLEGVSVQQPGGGATAAAAAAAAAAATPATPKSTPTPASLVPRPSAKQLQTGGAAADVKPPLPSKNESKSSLFSKDDATSKDLLTFYAQRGVEAVVSPVHTKQPASPAAAAAAGAGPAGTMTGAPAGAAAEEPTQMRISGLFLATRVVRELCVNSPSAKVRSSIAIIIALVQAFLPIIVRVSQSGDGEGKYVFGSHSWDSILLVCGCWFMTFAFTTILCLFVLVGVADYYRRYALMKVLGVMIDPTTSSETDKDVESAFKHLFIDLAIPANIPGWFAIRQVIHEFGINYRVRIQLYTSYSLVLAFGLFIVILVNIARGTAPDYVFITTVSFNCIVIFLLLAAMIYYGSKANEQYSVHQSILVRVQFAIREALAETMPFYSSAHNNFNVEYETLKQCESLIESVLKCLEMGNSTNPVTIMGVRASDQVFTSLMGFAATAFGTAARVLTTGSAD